MAKTWFFKTKAGEIFPVDDENKAWKYYKGNKNMPPLPYIGWSDGKAYKAHIAKARDKIRDDEMEINDMINDLDADIKSSRDLNDRKELKRERAKLARQLTKMYRSEKETVREAINQEIEAAKNNPDKTPPRDMDYIGYKSKQPLSEQQRGMFGRISF